MIYIEDVFCLFSDGLYCEREVDMWGGCWPDTPAGSLAVIKCPEIPAFDTSSKSF